MGKEKNGEDFWIRNETLSDPDTGELIEARVPLTPDDARKLIEAGHKVIVEKSDHRIFPIEEYTQVGCEDVEPNTWHKSPKNTVILGLKELPGEPDNLKHRHIFFGHAYKGQKGAEALLERFVQGNGTLYDMEEIADDNGTRLTTFGYWAGFVGAAMAVLEARGHLDKVERPMSKDGFTELLLRPAVEGAACPQVDKALVLGAAGRSGQGARAALEAAGISVTRWGRDETENLDREGLISHDLVVNAIGRSADETNAPPLIRRSDVENPASKIQIISDVTCDFSELNALKGINDEPTTWKNPVRRTPEGVAVIAIDNLPSATPREASKEFSAPLVNELRNFTMANPVWRRARRAFYRNVAAIQERGLTNPRKRREQQASALPTTGTTITAYEGWGLDTPTQPMRTGRARRPERRKL